MFFRRRSSRNGATDILRIRVHATLRDLRAFEHFGVGTSLYHNWSDFHGVQEVTLTLPKGWSVTPIREHGREILDERGRMRAELYGPKERQTLCVRPFYRVKCAYTSLERVNVRIEDANDTLYHEFSLSYDHRGCLPADMLPVGWDWLEANNIDHRDLTKYWD